MPTPKPILLDDRVLIFAPGERDGSLISRALGKGGIHHETCRDAADLCRKIGEGAGGVVLTERALSKTALRLLQRAIEQALPWSDLPILILTGREDSPGLALLEKHLLAGLGNVSLVERSPGGRTLQMAVHSALRQRRRQYQSRDLLGRQERSLQRVELLSEVGQWLLLSTGPEAEDPVGRVFRMIAKPLQLELCVCHLFNEKAGRLELSFRAGFTHELESKLESVGLQDTFYGRVARRRQPLVVSVPHSAKPGAHGQLKSMGITAGACFPLVANGRLIGTLTLGVRDRKRLAPEDVAFLETVSKLLAAALSRQEQDRALREANAKLEQSLQERTGQLKELTDQAESFAYTVSHDLRAPLRAIRGFAQAITEDYSSALDDTGRDFLRRMSEGADRLDRLIQDLLQYSRVGRSTGPLEPVEIQPLVERVVEQFEGEIRALGAHVEIECEVTAVLAQEPTLEQVIASLLSNALKFVARGVAPQVRIWTAENAQSVRVWVSDNGIGIDPVHQERIFGVFERLHTHDEYPGTGIGLAVVAKGMARMGGKFGLESKEGSGSRFWIELPKAA